MRNTAVFLLLGIFTLMHTLWAVEPPDQMADIVAACQQLNQEMAKPETQRAVMDAALAGDQSQAVEKAQWRERIEKCRGAYIATVTQKNQQLSWPDPGTKVPLTISTTTCMFGNLEFKIVSAQVDGFGLEAVKISGITGNIELNQAGIPVVININNAENLTAHLITADISPVN